MAERLSSPSARHRALSAESKIEMSEASNAESAPAVAGQSVVRPRHPWRQWDDRKAKLKAARKIARRRYERGELHKEWERTFLRIKRGIPIDAPILKPWDHAKGKWPNEQAHL
jgi:hypothetical protein